MHKYVQRKMKNSHDAAQAMKDLQAPMHGMQLYPSLMKSYSSDGTIIILITEGEKWYALYAWKQEMYNKWDSKNLTNYNLN